MYHYSIPIGSLTMSKILASGKTSARKCFTITKFWPSSTFVSKDKKDLLKVVFLNEREKKKKFQRRRFCLARIVWAPPPSQTPPDFIKISSLSLKQGLKTSSCECPCLKNPTCTGAF